MRAVRIIAEREVAAAFGRPAAWVLLGGALGLFSLLTLWVDDVLAGGVASVRGPLGWAAWVLWLVVPAATMGTFSEERRSGVAELVGALPISPLERVLGKWLGVMGLVVATLVTTLPWPVAVGALGALDPGPVFGGYLGLLLFGGALAAVGIACSAASESQAVAFAAALGLTGLPMVVGQALSRVPGPWAPWVAAATPGPVLAELARGVVEPGAIGLLVAVTIFGLRVAVHALEHERLR